MPQAFEEERSSRRPLPLPRETDDVRLDYRFLVAVDVEGFSKLSAREQRDLQYDLDRALNHAAECAGEHRETWERQPAGDGELAVLPGGTDGPRLVADFPRDLGQMLARLNAERRPAPRIRLRLAIHHGTLAAGYFGPVGRAPVMVTRLLDSRLLRRELQQRADEDLALIVSASLFTDVVETQFCGLNPEDFHSVRVHAKNVVYHAYIHRGGQAESRTRPACSARTYLHTA